MLIIILTILIMVKHKKIKFQLDNNRIQENSFLKWGEVMHMLIHSLTQISQKIQKLLNSLNVK